MHEALLFTSMSRLNKNNSAVKRILQEAKELANDNCTDYTAAPLEDDIFEWHCTIRGPSGTEFEGGLYHFRILLPSEYPFRPPSLMMLTPNGRFELNSKICISFTNYHEESWQPAWGVRTAILGLQALFPLKGKAALGVGGIETPVSDRKRLAALSRNWSCPHCKQTNLESLPDPTTHIHSSVELPGGEPVVVEAPAGEAPVTEPSAEEVPPSPELVTVIPSPPAEAVATPVAAEQPSSNNYPPISTAVTHVPSKAPRPPLILDTAICVLLVLVSALICRRFL